jgi:hypothetical protein
MKRTLTSVTIAALLLLIDALGGPAHALDNV